MIPPSQVAYDRQMPVNHLWAAMNRDIEEALIVLNSITPLAERDINQLAEELCDQIYASVLRWPLRS